MKCVERIEVGPSCGNVFADLGLTDANERLAKAELARQIRGIVNARNWARPRAAQALGLTQAETADLTRGKLASFSRVRLEQLVATLQAERP